jgi:hypothetical protein
MDVTWWGVPVIGLIVALVELAKGVGFPSRYAGVLAVVLGVVGGVLAYVFADSPAATAAVSGLVAGLSAAGLWSTAKHVVKG